MSSADDEEKRGGDDKKPNQNAIQWKSVEYTISS